MKKILFCLFILVFLTGCSTMSKTVDLDENTSFSEEKPLKIIATTTMLEDLVSVIGGEAVTVESLCGVGVDPHLYKATAGDLIKLNEADVVLYHGFHLEGELGDVFSSLKNQGKEIISLENGIDSSFLLSDGEDDTGNVDPHIWFDVLLWRMAALYVGQSLIEIDPNNGVIYQNNLDSYILELELLHDEVQTTLSSIPENQRVLITAHDAFQYFGNAYDFQVMGLQGISTESEASTADIRILATFIVEHSINAIFVESSVSSKNMEALQEAVRAQNFQVTMGGALYSDSLGDKNSGHHSYIATMRANVATILSGLGGEENESK